MLQVRDGPHAYLRSGSDRRRRLDSAAGWAALELEGRSASPGRGWRQSDLFDAARLRVGEVVAQRIRGYQGVVVGLAGDITGQPDRSELVIDAELPEGDALAGKVIYVAHPFHTESAYLIDRVERDGGGSRVRLAGKPRFVWGRAVVKSGGAGAL